MLYKKGTVRLKLLLSVICIIILVGFVVTTNDIIIPWQVKPVTAQAPNTLTTTSSKMVPYESPIYGIRIQHPANWKVEEGDNFLIGPCCTNVATFIPPGGKDNSGTYNTYVAISIEPRVTQSLDKYLKNIIKSLHIKSGNIIVSNANAILAGNPAYLLVNTETDSGVIYKVLEIGTITGGKAYFITYSAELSKYDSYLPTVYNMMKSFITKTTS